MNSLVPLLSLPLNFSVLTIRPLQWLTTISGQNRIWTAVYQGTMESGFSTVCANNNMHIYCVLGQRYVEILDVQAASFRLCYKNHNLIIVYKLFHMNMFSLFL